MKCSVLEMTSRSTLLSKLKGWQVSFKAKSHNLSPFLSLEIHWLTIFEKRMIFSHWVMFLVSVHALRRGLATFTFSFTLSLTCCSLTPPFLSLDTSKVGVNSSIIIDGEGVILPHNGNAPVLVGQVNLIGQSVSEST